MKKGIKYLLFIISGAAHIFVAIDYNFLKDSFTVPGQWHLQFYSLLTLSLFISLLFLFFNKYALIFIATRFFSLLLIGYPLGDHLDIETILLISIILESVYYLEKYYGVITSLALIAITILNQKPAYTWNEMSREVTVRDLLFLLFICLLVLSLSYTLKKTASQNNQKTRDLARLDYAVKELTKINLDFQSYASSIEHISIENERKRVSREMHDIIGYTLTNQLMIIQAGLSMKHSLSPHIESLLLQAQAQTRDGMEDARNALRKLRDFSPQREIGSKLIYKLCTTFEQVTGVTVTIDFGNSPLTMGSSIDSTVYRLIQEGLTNAFRHGKATEINITLFISEEIIYISIWDNGRGADKISEGIGLKGMRERIENLQGKIETRSLNSGFTIKVQIPFRELNKDDI
jgi:signal transduction histidine kinase